MINIKKFRVAIQLIIILFIILLLSLIISIFTPCIGCDNNFMKSYISNQTSLVSSASQFYVSDNREILKNKYYSGGKCMISTNELLEGKYITSKDLIIRDKNPFCGYVIYDINEEEYTFCFTEGHNEKYDYNSEICNDEIEYCSKNF